jgi:hypothetical protein
MTGDKHIDKLFKTPKIDFEKHLEIPYNSRIIFSGIFGIGKSYFLRRFFSLDAIKDNYEVIRLAPVNYTIASNEDILKYIKYDLLIELLSKGINMDHLNLDFSHYLTLYVMEYWKQIGTTVLKTAGSLAKIKVGNVDVFDQIIQFFSKLPDFKKFKNEKKDKYDDDAAVNEFMKQVEQSPHVYDETIVTRIIEKKIQALKKPTAETSKQTVLIIDDLDRIDPEHIFRILNVFGAHFENGQFESFSPAAANKFNFDKIILVCDINNIRNIFHAKYGSNVDFAGYIDKFYTHEVFQFDIRSLITEITYDIASKFQIGDRELKRKLTENDDQLLHYLLKALFNRNLINLRSFLKLYEQREQIQFRSVEIKGYKLDPSQHTILWQLVLLKQILGDRTTLLKAISGLSIYDIVDGRFDSEKVVGQILYCISFPEHHFTKQKDITYDFDEKITFLFDSPQQGYRVEHLKYLSADPSGADQGDPKYEEIAHDRYVMPLLKSLISWMSDINLL